MNVIWMLSSLSTLLSMHMLKNLLSLGSSNPLPSLIKISITPFSNLTPYVVFYIVFLSWNGMRKVGKQMKCFVQRFLTLGYIL